MAQVGDAVITASEFKGFVDRLSPGLRSDKEVREAQLDHLRSVVDQELMLLEARARGVDSSLTVRRELERLVRGRLTGRYRNELIVPRTQVTQPEVERAFTEWGFNRERLLSRIVVRRDDELDDVLRRLDAGDEFDALAEHYADNDLFAHGSGLVGWIGLSRAQKNFLVPKWAFLSLADGERAEPVRHPGAWQIYRFVDSRTAELETYEKDIRRLLRQEKRHAAVVEEFELLSHRYNLRLDEEGLRVLLAQTGPLRELELSADDADRMVYSFAGGEITVGDLVANLHDEGLGGIAFTDSADLVETAEGSLLHPLVFSLAAKERGWDREPAFTEWYRLKRAQVILTNLTRMETAGHASPSEEEVREYYLANEHRFVSQEKLYIREVVAGSAGEAVELRSEIERGVDIPEPDAWIERWPDAAQYMVFADATENFESWPKGTPEFNTAVKAWVTFWAEHIRSKGISPEQFALLLADTPANPDADARILAWAKPIREAGTGIRVWENVIHSSMDDANQDMINACHVLSPHYGSFLKQGDAFRNYFQNKREQGIALEYWNAWMGRTKDPYMGRLMPWTCWRYGAEAIHVWSFGDTGGASSWNEYVTTKLPYTPIFIDEVSVTAGKHLEATTEGIQDYEYLAMLDQAIQEASAQGIIGPELESARRLLETLPTRVCEAGGHGDDIEDDDFDWLNDSVDRTLADEARIQVLAALTELAGH